MKQKQQRNYNVAIMMMGRVPNHDNFGGEYQMCTLYIIHDRMAEENKVEKH